MRKLISVIIPVFNEEENLPFVYQAIGAICRPLAAKYDLEYIFVNDGSIDRSGDILEQLSYADPRVKYVEFSRNFGKELATTAGLYHSKGDATIMIDADMQFPPELIPEFIEKWENGAEVVTGIRVKNQGEGFIKKWGSYFYNKMMDAITESYHMPQATDFRLLDKKVVEEFNKFTERNRITRGLIDWLGFKRDFIYFTASPRLKGEAKYNPVKLLNLAVASFVSMSTVPLKIGGILGIILVVISGMLGSFMFIEQILLKDPLGFAFSGPAMLSVVIIFSVGVMLVSQGLLALYINQIHVESINRPIFVVRKKRNFDEDLEDVIYPKIKYPMIYAQQISRPRRKRE